MLFGIYVVVLNFVQTSTNNFLKLTFVMKCRFSVASHFFFLQTSQRFFLVAVNLGKRYFCKRGRRSHNFVLCASDLLTKLNNYNNSLFSYLTALVLWKKYRPWEHWMTLLLLHVNNSIVCFHYHLHFLRCLQRSQAQQQNFCTRENPNFDTKKNAHQRGIKIASLSTKRCQSWAT